MMLDGVMEASNHTVSHRIASNSTKLYRMELYRSVRFIIAESYRSPCIGYVWNRFARERCTAPMESHSDRDVPKTAGASSHAGRHPITPSFQNDTTYAFHCIHSHLFIPCMMRCLSHVLQTTYFCPTISISLECEEKISYTSINAGLSNSTSCLLSESTTNACSTVCPWYIFHGESGGMASRWLSVVAAGEQLAHYCKIQRDVVDRPATPSIQHQDVLLLFFPSGFNCKVKWMLEHSPGVSHKCCLCCVVLWCSSEKCPLSKSTELQNRVTATIQNIIIQAISWM